MTEYTHLIPENTAPKEAKRIVVFNSNGDKVGRIGLYGLKQKQTPKKLYSFGALADVHVTHDHDNAMAKFENAMSYFNDVEEVAFTCIAGDLVSTGTTAQFERWKTVFNKYDNVYTCTGNHDVENTSVAPFLTKESTIPYTGQELYYSFTQGTDLFIMFGMSGWVGKTGDIFTTEQLQWLYETLEANRDKRVFVLEHCPRFDGSGKVTDWANPTGNLLTGTSGEVFKSLMSHYKNVIWIHGHSHMEFEYQEYCSHLNYDRMFGCHSIHIPSLAEGRELDESGTGYVYTIEESSGYVVDVYKNHIVLRGRDFANNKFVPIATYCLDTTPIEIPAKSFTDSTGTITV